MRIAIGRGELDADKNENGVAAIAIILFRLLGAIVAGLLAREVDDLGVRSEQLDFGDVRTFFGESETSGVRSKHLRHFLVIALAEEVGVADGLAGQGKVKGKRGRSEKQARHENCGDPTAG